MFTVASEIMAVKKPIYFILALTLKDILDNGNTERYSILYNAVVSSDTLPL